MRLKLLPVMRHVSPLLPPKGVRDFFKTRCRSRKHSYMMVIYLCLFTAFLIRFFFVMSAVATIDGASATTDCSSLGCKWRRRHIDSFEVEEMFRVLMEYPNGEDLDLSDAPKSMDDFIADIRNNQYSSKTIALKLRNMVTLLEQKTRLAKIQEYLYRHVASSSIPKPVHCLSLTLADEYTTNFAARLSLPIPEHVPALVDACYHHFVLASDNVLAASVVAASLVRNSLHPQRLVLHIITDRKTFTAMHAWFSLHPLDPAVVEVKALHHFEWFTKGKINVIEAMEKDRTVRSQFRGGSSSIVASVTEKPRVVASKLQALSPKYNSIMNHIRINLPELFPSLKKVVFLDDDVVVQSDLSGLWDIDLEGKVNGAVETCRGIDKFVMSKRFRNYLNFSHPDISSKFDPEECAWAYGMNVFDLDSWRKTNITETYHHWIDKNLKSDLSLWQLGTLPPGLIAFHGHVKIIDPSWHMLGFGYQQNTSMSEVGKAAVIHFNGRAKPWLDLAFPELRGLWSKYVDFEDKFIKTCNIRP